LCVRGPSTLRTRRKTRNKFHPLRVVRRDSQKNRTKMFGVPSQKPMFFCAAATAVVVCLASSAKAGDSEIAQLVGRYGISPVQPPSPASDFSLTSLGDEKVSLSDAQGRWVLLTFFATWCGPCKSEMPALERLHKSHSDRGLDVVGVAIDGPRAAVQRFTKNLGVTFPVLVDENGKAANAYHASSVPITYVLDPLGRIVGVARGARDWAKTAPLFDQLIKLAPIDAGAGALYDKAGGAVLLPTSLVPPSATVTLSTAEPTVGTPFDVNVRVVWAGNFEDYLLHPPSIHLPESITIASTSASTTSRDAGPIVTYHFRLEPSAAGTFALDPVELRYTPKNENDPVATRITGPTVVIHGVTIAGLQPLVFVAILVGLCAALAALFFVLRHRPKAVAATNLQQAQHERWQEAFSAARRQRLEGNVAGFLQHLVELHDELGMPNPGLSKVVEQARYGGKPPPNQELDQLQRDVERRLVALAQHSHRPQRDAIRFADPTE